MGKNNPLHQPLVWAMQRFKKKKCYWGFVYIDQRNTTQANQDFKMLPTFALQNVI